MINWNKYQPKVSPERENHYVNFSNFFFYQYVITGTFKQHKNIITRYNILRVPGKNTIRNS